MSSTTAIAAQASSGRHDRQGRPRRRLRAIAWLYAYYSVSVPLPPTFPDLGALDLFVTVVRVGSVSRAAAIHGVSQPSASARLTQLERRLGVRVLERTPTGSAPTPDGAVIAGWAETVLDAAAALAAGVAALDARGGTRLRVMASYTVAELLLPGWLARLHTAHPRTAIELEVANSAAVIAALLERRVDLGFIESEGRTRGLSTRVVAHDVLVCVVASTHRWARRRGPLQAAQLSTTPLVTREPGSGTRDTLDRALAAVGLAPPPVELELGSTAAVKAAVLGGVGPALLSQLAVAAEIASGTLKVIEVDGLDLRRSLRAVHPAGQTLGSPAAALLTIAARSNP